MSERQTMTTQRCDRPLACELPKSEIPRAEPEATLRPHHQERLARLFRRAEGGADEHYLLEILTRYRGIETP